MTLIQQIKAAQITARKTGQKEMAATLSTLIGEAEAIGKNDGNRQVTDAEVIKLTKKFMDAATENINRFTAIGTADAMQKANALRAEIEIYSVFLPQQLTEVELRNIISQLVTTQPYLKIGDVVKHLKATYDGKYDGKLAAVIAKELI